MRTSSRPKQPAQLSLLTQSPSQAAACGRAAAPNNPFSSACSRSHCHKEQHADEQLSQTIRSAQPVHAATVIKSSMRTSSYPKQSAQLSLLTQPLSQRAACGRAAVPNNPLSSACSRSYCPKWQHAGEQLSQAICSAQPAYAPAVTNCSVRTSSCPKQSAQLSLLTQPLS
jgi:hypothetical protein